MSTAVMPEAPEAFVLDTRSSLVEEVEVRVVLLLPIDSDVAERLTEAHWRNGAVRIPDGGLAGDYKIAYTSFSTRDGFPVFEVNLKSLRSNQWTKGLT